MKSTHFAPCALFLFALSSSSNCAAQESKPAIHISSPSGFLTVEIGKNILSIAYQKIGLEAHFVEMPAKRSLVEANKGALDGEVNRVEAIGASFPNLIMVPTPINYVEQVLYSSLHSGPITDCSQLTNYKVGIIRGVKHATTCAEHAKEVVVFNNVTDLMKVLNLGRLDFAIAARVTGYPFERDPHYANIKPLTPALKRTELHHYLHKSNADLVGKLDRVFIDMTNSGELEKIRIKTIEDSLQ
ncbi:transporter substrate-binding domain-containing protein [Vibrio sp. SCSIO 43136]|uniref:substrate-binding periplasmic protein n=1 Tax=Vibrio sp. SCSIO 43136 TaxID=2819101 RepID=UPI0020756FF8|nr:transporter substrate-binding domain-containing protein [Vibrio sp. SCSIO 43136]USD66450.1 transporter substrate-binding domain-containing protein [Vibrio sp. SCSIO 43136]